MSRLSIGTNRWPAIATALMLVLTAFFAPIGEQRAVTDQAAPSLHTQTIAGALDDGEVAFWTTPPSSALFELDCSGIIEGSEDEWLGSFSCLESHAFMGPDGPSKRLSRPLYGQLFSRAAAIPLRC